MFAQKFHRIFYMFARLDISADSKIQVIAFFPGYGYRNVFGASHRPRFGDCDNRFRDLLVIKTYLRYLFCHFFDEIKGGGFYESDNRFCDFFIIDCIVDIVAFARLTDVAFKPEIYRDFLFCFPFPIEDTDYAFDF